MKPCRYMPSFHLATFLLVCLCSGSIAAEVLPPCPDTPNCVSSLSDNEDQRVDPLPGAPTPEESMALLESVIMSMPRTTWEQVSDRQAQATFTSLIMRFTDDVSFYIRNDGDIDVRSASRVGHWDFGANRRRVEEIREALTAGLPSVD